MQQCDVSVIIPAYNAAKFILEALDSILTQTMLPIEVLVIDDGSTDATSTVVQNWIAEAARPFAIQLIRQTNAGSPATRNVGIRQASSRWVAFFDADDIWEPNHLAALLDAVAVFPSAVGAYGAGRLFTEAGVHELLYDDFWENPSKKLGLPIAGSDVLRIDSVVFSRLLKGNFIKPSSLMVSAEAARAIGMFDETLRTAEDREFLIRLIFTGDLVYWPRSITRYRWHDDNLSHTKNARRNLENGLRVLRKIMLNDNLGLSDLQLKECRQELEHATQEYLYVSAKHGWSAYRESLAFSSMILGNRSAVAGVKPRHLIRALMSSY